jgi:Biotin/lipoate A/B protein ligase family
LGQAAWSRFVKFFLIFSDSDFFFLQEEAALRLQGKPIGLVLLSFFFWFWFFLLQEEAALRLQDNPIDVRIKWPNDLYSGSAKIGGVLCHSMYRDREFQVCVAECLPF